MPPGGGLDRRPTAEGVVQGVEGVRSGPWPTEMASDGADEARVRQSRQCVEQDRHRRLLIEFGGTEELDVAHESSQVCNPAHPGALQVGPQGLPLVGVHEGMVSRRLWWACCCAGIACAHAIGSSSASSRVNCRCLARSLGRSRMSAPGGLLSPESDPRLRRLSGRVWQMRGSQARRMGSGRSSSFQMSTLLPDASSHLPMPPRACRLDTDCPALHRRRPARSCAPRPQDTADQGRVRSDASKVDRDDGGRDRRRLRVTANRRLGMAHPRTPAHAAERHKRLVRLDGEWSEADDFFKPLHTTHLIERCPEITRFLDLPPAHDSSSHRATTTVGPTNHCWMSDPETRKGAAKTGRSLFPVCSRERKEALERASDLRVYLWAILGSNQ